MIEFLNIIITLTFLYQFTLKYNQYSSIIKFRETLK
jgi:hypothetical protein